MSKHISKHVIDGMNSKNSYRIKPRKHILDSDSPSSDEFMYEEYIDGDTPLVASPTPQKQKEPGIVNPVR